MARSSSEQWAKRVERWKDSGLSAKEFAAETGLKPSTLAYWRWRLSRAEQALESGAAERQRRTAPAKKSGNAKGRKRTATALPACVELPVVAMANAPAMLEMLLGEVRVRVPSGFDEATLTRVVRALGALR